MQNVVSQNIIRQALRWMLMPSPVIVFVESGKLPDGTLYCDYILDWTVAQVSARVRKPAEFFEDSYLYEFRLLLRHSFCRDITIIDLGQSCKTGHIRAYLQCTLDSRVTASTV